jgi:UPF0755 protein
MRRVVLVLAVVLAVAGVGAWWARGVYRAPGPLAQATAVVVPRGTQAEVGLALLRAGVIRNVRHFEVAARLTARAGALRAAEFLFPAHASLREVLAVLRTARPVQHRLTIPEGLTAAQEAELLDRTEALAGDVPVPAEGALLPDSYVFERGFTRAALEARAAAAMRKLVARVWAERTAGLPLKSPEELVTLASIVERETARPEERAHIAAVFINRLRAGMRLQSDPTVIYAVTGGAMSGGRVLTRADLETDNPYNTYRVAGLPPGPIGSPGRASLEAVARPAASDDLYFVADGTGGHVFARTLEEHHRNVARFLAQQRH